MCSGLTPACRTPTSQPFPTARAAQPSPPSSLPRHPFAFGYQPPLGFFLWLCSFPPPSSTVLGWAARSRVRLGISCCRRDGVFQAHGRKVPKSNPWHHGEAGYHVRQENQAAAKPGVQTLCTCFYSIGFIAVLLGIYRNKWRGVKFTVKEEMPFTANFMILIIVW